MQNSKKLVNTRFLLQNKDVLATLGEDTAEPHCPESLFQEIEAIRSHQRAHDDLLRDLTYQISQTNVTVFRQRVAENFTNLKEGFLALQKERQAERERLAEYKKRQQAEMEGMRADFAELLRHVNRLEGRLAGLQAGVARKQFKQDKALFVLREVVKRSGIYNHYLTFERPLLGGSGQGASVGTAKHACGTGSGANAAAAAQVDSFLAQLSHSADTQRAMLREAEERILRRFDQLQETQSQALQQHTEDVSTALQQQKIALSDFSRSLGDQIAVCKQQIADFSTDATARISTAKDASERTLSLMKAQLIDVQAEASRMSAHFVGQQQAIQQADSRATAALAGLSERVQVQSEAEKRLLSLQDQFDQYMRESRIQQFYVRVDDIYQNQEGLIQKISAQESVCEGLKTQFHDGLARLEQAEARLKQLNFDSSQALARTFAQYQEMKLKLAAFQQQVNIQSINELIQQKVDVDVVQFSAALISLQSASQRLEQDVMGQKQRLEQFQQQFSDFGNSFEAQAQQKTLLQDYNVVLLDDMSDIPAVADGVPGARPLRTASAPQAEGLAGRRAKAPKAHVLTALNARIAALERDAAELRQSLADTGERTRKSFEKAAEKLDRLRRAGADAQARQSTSDAQITQIQQAHEQVSELFSQLSEALHKETADAAALRAKFTVIEQSQKDAVRAVSTLSTNWADFSDQQSARIHDLQQATARELQNFKNELLAADAELKAQKKQLLKISQSTASFAINGADFEAKVAQTASKCDQVADEVIELRRDVLAATSTLSGMRFELTAVTGQCTNLGDKSGLLEHLEQQNRQYIQNLQNVCVEQNQQAAQLKAALEAHARDVQALKTRFSAVQKGNVTRSILQTTTDQETAGLQTLRGLLRDAGRECFKDDAQ